MKIRNLFFFITFFSASMSAMEDQNRPQKVSKEKINENMVVIIVNETLSLQPYNVFVEGVSRLFSDNDDIRSTDHPEGFLNQHPGMTKVPAGNSIKYALNLKKELDAGSPCWSIFENNSMVGYIQLKMGCYYDQDAHPILLIVRQQTSLQNGLDQQVCQAVVNHCFNVFGLECLEVRIDSRDHKFEQTVRACDFQEQIENNNNNDQQMRVIKIFIKRKK